MRRAPADAALRRATRFRGMGVAPRLNDDVHWMRRALELAKRGLGETNPNPMVGCVIVKDGRVVGEGHHRRAGGPHAEVVALERAGSRARSAALYVNLEPCSHHGRTPPCAPRLVEAGIGRVVAAMRDPSPHVNGRGFSWLRRSGIEVTVGAMESEATLLNERFVIAARERRPFVLLKAALTLDGRIATSRGRSKWITSPAQRRAARALRRLHDAVLVGVGTVLADDPLLLPEPRVQRPFHRVVLDSRLRTPLSSRLVRSAHRSPVWILCAEAEPRRRERLESRGVRVREGPSRGGRVSLKWAMRALWEEGIWSLMVEGGSEALGTFLAQRLLDQVVLFRAPLILGGRGSLPAFGGENPLRLAQALRLSRRSPLLKGLPDPIPPGWPSMESGDSIEVWYP